MRSLICGLSLVVCSAFIGCGDDGPATSPVTGKVTFEGEAYPNAIISFSPVGGGPSAIGKSNASGEYELFTAGKKGAVAGKHKVSVITEVVPDAKATSSSDIRSDDPEYAKKMAEAARGGSKQAGPPKEKLPAKYNAKTELEYEVGAGKNQIDLTLTK